ncbi:MAG: aldehyde ferredoxin oxidoreductase C-terminal domain-containing protein [Candidatus Thorarchaeota archaeon]|nr:aldehyde ferredoxin oxidoreductase C-terminal domain-containing protein [Candidatus Thorarchaeota archaeon]
MGKILRIDMSDLSHKWEDTPAKYKDLAGRAFTSKVVREEVDPTCHPLRENNKFVISPGLLAGTLAPSSGRLSVGAKSPLTGGIKESSAGGLTATRLARIDVPGIIIEGAPSKDEWYSIYIGKEKCEIKKTNDYAGMGLYDLIGKIWKDTGAKPGIIGSGIAGQRLLVGAGVFGNNIENSDPGRYAGRGGLGAVLGSKRIVAIISDDAGGERPKPKDVDKFENGRKALREALDTHPVTGVLNDDKGEPFGGLKNYGTNVLQNILSEAGGLPTKGFSTGRFDAAAKISGEAVHELIDKTKEKFGDKAEGKYAHACHPGCVMSCSNVVPYEDTGKLHVSPLEYETAWALGANLDISSLHDVAELNRICNDIGLDTIEAGNTIAMLMEGGLVEYGDGPGAIAALKEAYDAKSAMGKLVCSGTLLAGKALGVTRIPVVKGQALPAYDPRPIRGIGVTYATTPMGADHTAGYTIAAEILGIKGTVTDPRALDKAELSKAFQSTTAYIDFSGYCLFIAFAILDNDDGMKGMTDTVDAFLGKSVDIGEMGTSILKDERDFNKLAGFTKNDDRLPEFFRTEPLPPHNVTFDVTDEELDAVFKDL